jgi:hypothetical protein
MTLKKATLQEIGPQPTVRPVPVPGTLITVQVNPTSLRLALTNNTDVGKSVGRPNTTFQGSSSSTLSFDLMMDTADQADQADQKTKPPGGPVDVQTLTAQLERFMLPKTGEPKGVPPRVLFTYGSLRVAGVMSALNLEYDLFSSTGVPLRAKASVTIKEQMPQFNADLLGAGANKGSAATPAVPSTKGSGARAAGSPADRTGTALGGESAADFATRMGLDPSTWKTFAAGISDPLSLDAGLQIDFSSSASASAGIGVQAGATATGTGADPADATTPVNSLSPAALTAAGGVSATIAQQALSQSAAVAATARAAFAAAAATPAGGTPTAPAAAQAAGTGSGASPVPQFSPDPRATSFGFGIPLRPLIPLPNRAAVALVHDVARGQTWPPAGILGGPTAPATGPGPAPGAGSGAAGGCGCGCGGGS